MTYVEGVLWETASGSDASKMRCDHQGEEAIETYAEVNERKVVEL